MNDSLAEIVQLRNNIDFASAAQFFHTFSSAFRPWPVTTQDIIYSRAVDPNEYIFETEDLERMILDPTERIRFEDLMVRMLRLCSGKRFINSSTWQQHFQKEFDKREIDDNPLIDTASTELKTINYFDLPLQTRIHLLHLLCDWQLEEPEKFREHLESEEDAVQWRVDPVGYDKRGAVFWLFDDNRLYKESTEPKKKRPVKKRKIEVKSRRSTRRAAPKNVEQQEEESESEDEENWLPWKLLCHTKLDWETFPSQYANSKNLDEQRFYHLLVNDLVPKIIPVMEDREKEIKKQEAIIHRKRSSRIMMKELTSLESPMIEQPLELKRGSSRIEQRQAEKEQKELEQAAKAREERALERERRIAEREYRVLARQHKEELEEEPVVEEKKPKPVQVEVEQVKPKRKYIKKPKFDEFGHPLPKPPRKPKLDADGNPIPLKKRGRKPKSKDLSEESWIFDCSVCGVSGKNLDDGEPMMACEKCGVWQHIQCLQNSGQIEKTKSLESISFVCKPCIENQHMVIQHTPFVIQPVVESRPTLEPMRHLQEISFLTTSSSTSSLESPSSVRVEPPTPIAFRSPSPEPLSSSMQQAQSIHQPSPSFSSTLSNIRGSSVAIQSFSNTQTLMQEQQPIQQPTDSSHESKESSVAATSPTNTAHVPIAAFNNENVTQ